MSSVLTPHPLEAKQYPNNSSLS